MTKLETITNFVYENGITYFPIFEEMESIGKHFFLDKDFDLICCPSLASGGYEIEGMEYVADWICNELTEAEKAEFEEIDTRLQIRVAKWNRSGWPLKRI